MYRKIMNLLSIIIPTKNRQKYCIKAIEQIISLHLQDIQIVIQDNSDDNTMGKFIQNLNDARIKYNYHPGILSFVDNFSEGVSLADGEYLCMIGDDDGLLPNIIDVVNFAKRGNYDAVIPGLNAFFVWPMEKSIVKNGEKGYLQIAYLKSSGKDVDSHAALSDLMSSGGQNYQSFNLPRLYHGIVKKSTIDKVKKKTGKYFSGLTPDIYMAVALAYVCEKVYRINFPITISGVCSTSGSSDSATGKHTGNLKDAPHFKGHKEYSWEVKAPKIYSVESIWAETALQAIHDFSDENLYENFRVDILDGICLIKYPQFAKAIKEHAANYGYSLFTIKARGYLMRFKSFVRRVFKFITRKKGEVLRFYNISDIKIAGELVMKEILESEISIV